MASKLLKMMFLLILAVNFAACGDGVSEGGEDGPAPGDIVLTTSSPQLPTADNETVTLTAFVRDQNNVLMEGEEVEFSTDDGTIEVVRPITDDTGTAQALLSTPGNKSNREIDVRASTGKISETIRLRVSGTTISVSGPEQATQGNLVELLINLKDSNGNGIPNIDISVESKAGNPVGEVLKTNSSGQTTAAITMNEVDSSGNDIITVSANGATTTHTVEVSIDFLSFIAPTPQSELPILTEHSVAIRWLHAGEPVPGTIHFSASRGTLSPVSKNTDPAGEATTIISSDNAGWSTVTATTNSGLSAGIDLLFIATEADNITLQAHPAVIGTNVQGESSEQSEIIAVVRDENGNLVKNQTVHFNLFDISGGTLHPSTAVTDIMGRASTNYTAGSSSSARDGVEVTATVLGTSPVVKEMVTLTTAQKSLYITLGTGNTVNEPDPTRYALPYSVLVTDAAGGPVANTEVSLSLWPADYYKGNYIYSGLRKLWEPVIISPACPNEDWEFRDGIYTPEKDYNNNQRLDPGNVATLSTSKVVSDDNGFAEFEVLYAKQFANWVDMELTARAFVAGSEHVEVSYFNLPILGSDIEDEAVSPPGHPSPFGVSESCLDYRADDEKNIDSIMVRTGAESAVASTESPPIAVIATVRSTDGSTVADATVLFSTTLGTIVDDSGAPVDSVTTDNQGEARAFLQPGNTAGNAEIRAYASGFMDVATINLLPGAPAVLLLEAIPATIATNSTAEIQATVMDNNDNPIPGEEVTFSLIINPSQGELSATSEHTGDNGRASVDFEAKGIEGINTIRATSNGREDTVEVEVAD